MNLSKRSMFMLLKLELTPSATRGHKHIINLVVENGSVSESLNEGDVKYVEQNSSNVISEYERMLPYVTK
jgi:hypothetical protein